MISTSWIFPAVILNYAVRVRAWVGIPAHLFYVSYDDRYLCPQEPPAGLNTVYKCAHYVRLLPYLEDWQMFEGVHDMWCTSQQFLVGRTQTMGCRRAEISIGRQNLKCK